MSTVALSQEVPSTVTVPPVSTPPVSTPPVWSASSRMGLPMPRLPKALLLLVLQFTLAAGLAAPAPLAPSRISMPNPPLWWIELAPISFSFVSSAAPASLFMSTPSPVLKAISFWLAGVVRVRSPISIFFVWWSWSDTSEMPTALPREAPATLVPM